MANLRISARALVVFLVMALATPAFADPTPEEKRAAAQAKKAQAAAQLDTLKANDAELEAAVKALDAGVAIEAANTDAAQQALRAAERSLTTAQARLAATEAKMADLRAKVAEAAVRAYVHPGGDTLLEIVRSKDLGEASRRQALLAHVVSSDRDIVDQMRAARQDEQMEKENLAEAASVAADRKKAAAEKLAGLEKARNDQVKLKNALDARIEQVTSEVAALAREEATLSALIRARQAPPEASSPAAPAGNAAPAKVGGSGVAWPTNGSVTSGFGYRWGSLHAGIDIANGVGTPIRAAKAGTIILAGWNGGYGNCIVIDHGGGFSTLYGHMTRLRASDGQRVSQGDLIGDMGSTGNSTGSHLHFETRVNGSPQDPTRYLP
ncbi:MAG TPA: peptidoglycan DD-metalloendopeptidase family protein [Acidimicrobiales bacterium]|nr:peptidoglycan DD-metalloendopeptidase family protein [Acidimicrobiales bacterium]